MRSLQHWAALKAEYKAFCVVYYLPNPFAMDQMRDTVNF